MGKKLHIGNLSYNTTEDGLRGLFAEVGTVASATIIMDRDSGRSKGFGFVEMESDQAAQEAISRLNNHDLDQRSITVAEARPRERSFGGSNDRSRGGQRSNW